MSQQKVTTLIVLVFLILMTTAVIVSQSSSVTLAEKQLEIERAIARYVEQKQFAQPATWSKEIADAYLQNCLELAEKQSGKEFDTVQINKRIDSSSINVFFINDDPDQLFTAFRGNCVSIGYKNIILCDLRFIERLQAPEVTEEFTNSDNDETADLFANARLRQQSLAWLWVVGHEIGHIAHEHNERHFHFAGDQDHKLVSDNRGEYSQQEKEADDFAIRAVGTDSLGRLMYQGIHQFVNSEGARIAKSLGEENWQQLDAIPLQHSSSSHPPLFYRAARFNLAIINHFVADPNQLKLPGLEDYDGKIYLIESPDYYEGIMRRVRFEEKQ